MGEGEVYGEESGSGMVTACSRVRATVTLLVDGNTVGRYLFFVGIREKGTITLFLKYVS